MIRKTRNRGAITLGALVVPAVAMFAAGTGSTTKPDAPAAIAAKAPSHRAHGRVQGRAARHRTGSRRLRHHHRARRPRASRRRSG